MRLNYSLLLIMLGLPELFLAQATRESREPEIIAEHLDSLAYYYRQDNFSKALPILSKVEGLISEESPDSLYLEYLFRSGAIYFSINELPIAEARLKAAVAKAKVSQDSVILIACWSLLSNTYTKKGDFTEALVYYDSTLPRLKGRAPRDYHRALVNRSNAYSSIGLNNEALQDLRQAKDFFLENDDSLSLGVVFNNIGELYRGAIGDFPKARQHYREAIKINQSLGNAYNLAKNYHNLALTHLDEGTYDSARFYLERSQAMRQKIGDEIGQASGTYLSGRIYLEQGNYQAAEHAFLEALTVSEKHQLGEGIYHANHTLGKLYLQQRAFPLAETHLQKAAHMAKMGGQSSALVNTLEELYLLHKIQGKHQEALQEHERLKELEDSLEERQSTLKFESARMDYENDLTEAENATLKLEREQRQKQMASQKRLRNIAWISSGVFLILLLFLYFLSRKRKEALIEAKELKEQWEEQYRISHEREQELSEANNFKNRVLSVLGHDLRSPLAMISGLLGTISTAEITKEELDELFVQLKEETDISLRNLEEILKWARMQMSELSLSYESIDMGQMIEQWKQDYRTKLREKDLTIHYQEDIQQDIRADRVQVKSMVGNILSNAIKFSPKQGAINIDLQQKDNEYHLTVSDQGAGIGEAVIKNLQKRSGTISSKGTKGEKGMGIGLRIVHDFVIAHGGSLHFENKSPGTEIRITLPQGPGKAEA